MRSVRTAWLQAAVLSLVVAFPASSQLRAPSVGVVEAGLLLRQLDGEKRVLMIGAHPDDEDTSLLAALALGMGARTAYLSLTRGEGGQNLIGAELGEGLGIVRSGELLSARALDGAEQYFTRAFDFGFSKSAEETFDHWPVEEVLSDVVWVIRRFRPHVIVSIFSGTPRDGHGHHQAAGILARRAFEEAGDSTRFAAQFDAGVAPWAPDKLYQLVGGPLGGVALAVETGTLDPLLGRSYHQVAMAGRSRHRSQDMGTAEPPGPRQSHLWRVPARGEAAIPQPPSPMGRRRVRARGEAAPVQGDALFSGIDTTLTGLALRAAGAGDPTAVLEELRLYRGAIQVARDSWHTGHPASSADPLLIASAALDRALAGAAELPEGPHRSELLDVLQRRRGLVADALLAAAGVWVDVRFDRPELVHGDFARFQVMVWNGGPVPFWVDAVRPAYPEEWPLLQTSSTRDVEAGTVKVGPGELRTWNFQLSVLEGPPPTRPYFLTSERDGSLYRWPDESRLRGLPFDPPLLQAELTFRAGDEGAFVVNRAAAHVGVDKAHGEFRVPIQVAPRISVAVSPEVMAWPAASTEGREITVRVRNLTDSASDAAVSLDGLPGWEVTPDRADGQIPGDGGESAFQFMVRPGNPASVGRVQFTARVEVEGEVYDEGLRMIDYPHIDPVPIYDPAEIRISRFPVELREGLRVGYLMGPGDGGMQALQDMGVDVEAIDPEELRSDDLNRFHTIVLGIRAYETRADLLQSNARLLDFARAGGTVVVQYNKYEYPEGGFAPFALDMRRPHDRVTNPEAPVTLLDPAHPLLSSPNRIDARDFEGWDQERGLYFLSEWDARYTPLLEMADPGEEPNRGSLVVARVGAGAYVYTGLALFRQFPAGVPGAYRLLANLVSLRGSDL